MTRTPADNSLDGLALGVAPAAGMEAIGKAIETANTVAAATYAKNAGGYGVLLGGIGAFKVAIQDAMDNGAPVQLVDEAWKTVKPTALEYLQGLSTEELEKLAAEQGFEHPGLIGLHTEPGKQHPLVFWLNPVYPADHEKKLYLQEKALTRWQMLQSGGAVEGMTLQEYLAAHPLEEGAAVLPVEALTPEEFEALKEKIEQLQAFCESAWKKSQTDKTDEFKAEWANAKLDYYSLVRKFNTATCTDPAFVKPKLSFWHNYPASISAAELPILAARLESEYGLSLFDASIAHSAINGGFGSFLTATGQSKEIADDKAAKTKAALTELVDHIPYILAPARPDDRVVAPVRGEGARVANPHARICEGGGRVLPSPAACEAVPQ